MTFQFELQARALGGVFTRRDARVWGMSDNALRDSVRRREIARLGYGVYAFGDLPQTREARHAALTRGILRARPRARAAARSTLTLYDLPVVLADLDTVILCAPGRERYHRPGVITYPTPEGEPVTRVHGVPSVSLETAIFQTVGRDSLTTAIVAADAALHRDLTTVDALDQRRHALKRLAPRSQQVLAGVDAKSESPGESLARILLRGLGYEVQTQVVIQLPYGGHARVDALVEGMVVVEFDGAVKYGEATGREALIAEKRREDALRAMGYVVVRLTLSDLFTKGRLAQIMVEALRQARRLQASRGQVPA